jgi:ribonuclease-3
MEQLEQKIHYTFRDKAVLTLALTHSSKAHEHKGAGGCNERLEFLGDSVLSIIVSDYLYKTHPDMPEGELSKLRASLVCEKSLCAFAKEIDLGSYLLLGRGEEHMGGRERPSILADAFEALIAAIYLDGSLDKARTFVLYFIKNQLKSAQTIAFKDYKTRLQEIIQQNPEEQLYYSLTGESGPDHDKTFEVELHLNSNVIGKGSGRSKKEAEQMAAKEALELMGDK